MQIGPALAGGRGLDDLGGGSVGRSLEVFVLVI